MYKTLSDWYFYNEWEMGKTCRHAWKEGAEKILSSVYEGVRYSYTVQQWVVQYIKLSGCIIINLRKLHWARHVERILEDRIPKHMLKVKTEDDVLLGRHHWWNWQSILKYIRCGQGKERSWGIKFRRLKWCYS